MSCPPPLSLKYFGNLAIFYLQQLLFIALINIMKENQNAIMYLDEMENFICKKMNILQFAK